MSRKMFSKFTSIIHSAVEALAPNLPHQQNFVGHWKAVTRYFIENKEHKVAIEQTVIPGHLEAMLRILQEEEGDLESGSTGPCMEYLLQHKILETLYTLARTDCPPGMKQQVLVFFTALLSKTSQPLLPHINVHKAVHRLVRVCGEIKAAPTENEEIQFLCTVCAKLKMDPYLVNFFIESPKPSPEEKAEKKRPVFAIMNSLLNLIHSADARVAVKACEGLMLCVSLPEQSSATCIVEHTAFCSELTEQLCQLYAKLPKAMDPADIECVEAKWGLDIMSDKEDHLNFAGKRALLSFLSWLDYCDQLVRVAHPLVSAALAQSIREHFLTAIIEPTILQTSEAGATTATAHLCRCLRLVSSPVLLSVFVRFILGDDRMPETRDETSGSGNRLRERLLERCNHLSEEMSITSLKLLETLLLKPDEHVIHNLVLRNLLGRGYYPVDSAHSPQGTSPARHERTRRRTASGRSSGSAGAAATPAAAAAAGEGCSEGDVDGNKAEEGLHKAETRENESRAETADGGTAAGEAGTGEHGAGEPGAATERKTQARDESEVGKEKEQRGTIEGLNEDQDNLDDDFTDDLSPPSSPTNCPSVHTVVNSFLGLVPDEAKSSYQTADSEYDTYLRDARRQFSDVCAQCVEWGWPTEVQKDEAYAQPAFYEGAFMAVLLDKLSRMLDQSYDVNLQVTSVVSRLAMLPHPNLHEYLLNPLLHTPDGVRTLTKTIKKVVRDVEQRMKKSPDFSRQLSSVRQQLMGMADNIRRAKARDSNSCVDDSGLLEGVIVLEEFCKELAAIACVKYYAAASL